MLMADDWPNFLFSPGLRTVLYIYYGSLEADVVPVARLEAFRALKFSRLESFRALNPNSQIGGLKNHKTLQIGEFKSPMILHTGDS